MFETSSMFSSFGNSEAQFGHFTAFIGISVQQYLHSFVFLRITFVLNFSIKQMRRYKIKMIMKKLNNDPKNTPKFQVIAPAALASANVLYFFVPFLPRSTTNLY